jgi:outer membrane protein assembly factor BamA
MMPSPRSPAAPRAGLFLALLPFSAWLAVQAPRACAQERKTGGGDTEIRPRPHIMVLPLLYYTPETRVAFGVGGNMNFNLGRDKAKTRPSSIWFFAVYTMNNQVQIQLNPEIYFPKNVFVVNSTLKYVRFPQKFYGIGNSVSASAAESYAPETIGFGISVQRKLVGSVFAGLQYRVEKTRIESIEPGGLLDGAVIPGRDGGVISGLGFTISWDSRDNVFFPRKGYYFRFVADYYTSVLGSDYHFTSTRLDLRRYIPVFSTHVLALQAYIGNMGGSPPFYELSMLGGASLLRGNYTGQYRDKALGAVQMEYRMPLWWRFGVVAFAGLGDVAPDLRRIEFNNLKYSLGAGLRYKLDAREGTNLRLDFAWGKGSTGLYVTVQEAF